MICFRKINITINNKEVKIIKMATLSVFIFGSFSDVLFTLNSTMSLFAFMIGIVFVQFRFENQKEYSQ